MLLLGGRDARGLCRVRVLGQRDHDRRNRGRVLGPGGIRRVCQHDADPFGVPVSHWHLNTNACPHAVWDRHEDNYKHADTVVNRNSVNDSNTNPVKHRDTVTDPDPDCRRDTNHDTDSH